MRGCIQQSQGQRKVGGGVTRGVQTYEKWISIRNSAVDQGFFEL